MQKKERKIIPLDNKKTDEPMIVQMSRYLIVPNAPESLIKRLKGFTEEHTLMVAIKKMNVVLGTAGLYMLDGNCMMWIEIERNYMDLKKYCPVLKRNMEDLSKYDLTHVELQRAPDFEVVKTLEKQYAFNEGLMELKKIIQKLRNKGWKKRRIDRYVLNKYKIRLTK